MRIDISTLSYAAKNELASQIVKAKYPRVVDENASWHEKVTQGLFLAGRHAIEMARITNTKLVIWKDGQVAELTAEEFEDFERAQREERREANHVSH